MIYNNSKVKCRNLYMPVIALAFFLISFSSVQCQTGFKDPRMKGVDSAVQKFLNDWFVPGGATVAISKDGRLVYERGFGEVNNTSERRIYPENKFRVASVSKPITSVAILQLIENGQLNFDDIVFGSDGVLNEFSPIDDSRINDITIYHLLHHLGGWGEAPMFKSLQVADEMGVPPPPSQSIIIEYMMGKSLDNKPGSSYKYSNFGYLVLGRVIERISGVPYEDFINEHIFNEIGATSFVLAVNNPDSQNLEEAYYFSYRTAESVYGDGSIVPMQYGGFDIEAMDSHGGWVCKASDLIRFATSVDGNSSRPDIISPLTRQFMITPSSHSNYAKGWVVGNGNMWHVGSLPGTSAETVGIGNGNITFTIIVNFRFESNTNLFNSEMDAAMWDGINSVSEWPEYDLFTDTPEPIEPEEGDVINEIELDTTTNWGSVVWDGNSAWVLREVDNNWYEVDKLAGLTGASFSNPEGAQSDTKGAAWSTTKESIFSNQNELNEGEVWEFDKNGIKLNSWSTGLGIHQRGLAIHHDEIWIALPGSIIYRFDMAGQKLDDVILDVSLQSPMSIEWVDGDLWVNDSIDNLIRIFDYSEETLELSKKMDIPAPYSGLTGLSFTGDEVLATGLTNNILYWLKTANTTAVGDVISDVNLTYNYPNPFCSTTTINYSINEPAKVSLVVYNIQGQEVANVVNEFKVAGKYSVNWNCTSDNGNKVVPGIYFYKIRSGKYSALKKMIMIE